MKLIRVDSIEDAIRSKVKYFDYFDVVRIPVEKQMLFNDKYDKYNHDKLDHIKFPFVINRLVMEYTYNGVLSYSNYKNSDVESSLLTLSLSLEFLDIKTPFIFNENDIVIGLLLGSYVEFIDLDQSKPYWKDFFFLLSQKKEYSTVKELLEDLKKHIHYRYGDKGTQQALANIKLLKEFKVL